MSDPTSSTPQDNDNQQPSIALTKETILNVLSKGELKDTHGMLRYSSNYTFLISVEHDDLTLAAIYKPRKGERPLWDFPDGTLYKRERAAYLTSDALGWGIVPPTVIRSGQHGVGSLQFFIDHNPKMNYFAFDDSYTEQLARISLFDVLVNNADRKGGHCLLDTNDQIWGIDHGITFNEEHKLRTVIWDFAGQVVPEPLLQDVTALKAKLQDPDSAYHKYMTDLINPQEMAAFIRRIDKILDTKRYPEPGAGPNYPWPAV